MSRIEIVPATAADALVVLDLIRGLAEYEKRPHAVTATEGQLRATLFGSPPEDETLLAYWDGECAGFAVFFPTYSTFLAQRGIYLEDLYVKSHLRGNGIGSALLERLAQLAMERGCANMEWSVLSWNEPSIRFYEKLGANAMDDWVKYRITGDALRRLAGPG